MMSDRASSNRDTTVKAEILAINIAESPLALLYRLSDKSGCKFLSEAEFIAGERLRADFTRGQMMPHVTAQWHRVSVKQVKGQRGAGADYSDYTIDCRARVNRALAAVGPELSGLLVDICCFLKGLTQVERERGWPARSAKMLLKTALGILQRHYNGDRQPAEPNLRHWGDKDYRPSVKG
jgi:hypothetical protein